MTDRKETSLQPSKRAHKRAERRRWHRAGDAAYDYVGSFVNMRGGPKGFRSTTTGLLGDGESFALVICTRGDADPLRSRIERVIREWMAEQ